MHDVKTVSHPKIVSHVCHRAESVHLSEQYKYAINQFLRQYHFTHTHTHMGGRFF